MSKSIENRYDPDHVSPPGLTLDEILGERGMSQAELSRRMGRPKKTINEIVKGKASITPETALQLEKVLGIPAQFWSNRQRHYDQFIARKDERELLKNQIVWLQRFPVKAMIKLGWIRKREDDVEQVVEVLRFFGVASPTQWELIATDAATSFRLAKTYESQNEDLSAWLRMGEIVAGERYCDPFDRDKFLYLLRNEIRPLTTSDPDFFQPRLSELCAEAGVAVAFVPQLPEARVSGATRWVARDKALIQLSLRYKTDDHLWFTFFHEAGHIVLHGKREIFIEGDKTMQDPHEKESQADRFAADILIPADELEEFLESLPPRRFPSEAQIIFFADRMGIAPSIVLGRLQHDRLPVDSPLPFSYFRHLRKGLEWASVN